jgi:hypothetical protein
MAEKIIVEIDLNQGDVRGATSALEKSGERAGQKAAVKFSKSFDDGISSAISSIAKTAFKATAAVGSLASAFLGFKSIQAAQVQEDAINSLNSALLLSKNASIEASNGIQQFASQLQQSTRFGDEVILQNAALIQSLGDLDEKGLKQATQAAADLATVLRVDLGTAATLVGKAAAGEVGSFSRYGLAIQKGANNAETFANALTAIQNKFGGAAQRDVLTYSGATDQLSNAFGDLLEEFGKLITQNPSVVAAIKSVTGLIQSATTQVAQFAKTFNIFEVISKSLVAFNDAVITYIVSPLELAVNIGNVFFSAINSAAATSIAIIGQVGGAIGSLLSKFGIMNNLSQGLKDFAASSEQTALQVNAGLTSAINNIGSFPLSDNLAQRNEELRQFFTDQQEIALQANTTTAAINQSIVAQSTASAMGIRDVYASVFDGLTMGYGNFVGKIDEANKKIRGFSIQAGKTLQQGFAQSAGNAFSAFGAALVKGENALEAFGKMLLKSIGEQAVTLGTKFILEGTAYLFSPGLQGLAPQLIASGAALAAFGGALGAASGGGGSTSGSAAGGATGAGANVTNTEVLAEPEAARQAEERTVLNLNIEGSMVRESEASSWITSLLEESGKTNSNLIPSLKTGIA